MQVDTNKTRRAIGAIAISSALALAAGCHSKNVSASGPDPAQANLAPATGQTQVLAQNASYAPQQQGESYPQQAPAPIEQAYPQGYQPTPDEQAGEEALEETTQAPPALPEYDQPPAPGPDYIWTPGYWAWGPSGYYWVPGAWVEAPYYGALWTPPYWGWSNGYYRFHPGYWGLHVGYYGGIDYGFGYIGIGYFGGYWSGNNFYYNRAVTHVGPAIRTVYQRPVVYDNVHYGVQPRNRVSYNGGHGGINVQPRPAEVAAMHERHYAPLAVQRQARVQASQNREQSFAANHGRPEMAYAAHGFTRGAAPAPAPRVEAARTAEPNPAFNRAQPQPNAGHFENRNQPQPNAGNPHYDNRAQPQPNAGHFENRTQPQPQPPHAEQPRVENHAAQPNNNAPRFDHQPSREAQPHAEYRPQPQPQPRAEAPHVENRPMPQPQPQRMEAPHVENRPMPQQQPHPQGPPPQSHPAPQAQPHNGGGGGHPGGGDHGDHGHR